MAHFAKINENNTVIQLVVVNNDVITENGVEIEQKGVDFLRQIYNEPNANWKKSSYNTFGGQYYTVNSQGLKILGSDQSKAFRKNSASLNGTYDSTRDAFIPEKLYNTWTLNEETCLWESPIPFPSNDQGIVYIWSNNTNNWETVS